MSCERVIEVHHCPSMNAKVSPLSVERKVVRAVVARDRLQIVYLVWFQYFQWYSRYYAVLFRDV